MIHGHAHQRQENVQAADTQLNAKTSEPMRGLCAKRVSPHCARMRKAVGYTASHPVLAGVKALDPSASGEEANATTACAAPLHGYLS